jgi:DUF1365 family protein
MRHSTIYVGHVMHRRLRPLSHRLNYRVFSLYLDLDELPDLHRCLRLFSHNRFNLFSLYDRDFGTRDGGPLRPWVEAAMARGGVDLAGGSVRMLCFPRILGYAFNPLTMFFGYGRDGRLVGVLYAVANTFGERHSYMFPVEGGGGPAPLRHGCGKHFYVSPFMPMRSWYRFRLKPPTETYDLLIRQSVDEGEILVASHRARRVELSDRNLLRAFLTHPLLTLKVMAGIHWEALKLWRRGAALQPRPLPPDREVSYPGNAVTENGP